MTQVVQARCPFCKKVLRIPADWLSRPMKCKQCQQIFQTRNKSAVPEAVAVPVGVAKQTPLPPSAPNPAAQAPFGFNEGPIRPLVARRPTSGNRGRWKGPVVGAVMLVVTGAIFYFAYPHLAGLFHKSDADGADKLVEVKDDKAGDGTKDKTIQTSEDDVKPPIKDKRSKEKGTKDKEKTPLTGNELFPRRALLINVSNYLLFNPLTYGSPRENKYPGSSTAVLADQLTRPPMNMPGSQVIELADASSKPFSTTKPVIESAISDFVDTAREQDRLILLFTGHAIDIDKKPYLVPVEGRRDKPETLIPLGWVTDQLAKSKARQKILILDVFRFPPARGEELAGTGELTEDFEAFLQSPPAGVQVWASCAKGQMSLEFENGSLFLQALCNSLQERGKGITEPTASLPIESLLPKVNQRMKEVLGPRKLEQISLLFGKEANDGALYNGKDPLAAKVVLKLPEGAGATQGLVKNMLEEIDFIPSPRGAKQSINAASLPLMPASALEEYKADYRTFKELETMVKDKEKYPLRAAYFEVQKILKESDKIRFQSFFPSPGSPVPPAVKKTIEAQQRPIGAMQYELKEALTQLLEVGTKREMETSKRWQVNYDLAVARLKARLVYLNEYNEVLAKVRGDALPELNPGDTGFRVGASLKVSTKESEYKKMEKDVKKTLTAIAKNHPDTPWAIIAQRESMTALGLIWRASRE